MATAAYSTPAPEDGAHHRTRRAVEAHIEFLIGLLDEIDGDPDLEPDADGEDNHDAECDPAEHGIADADGAAEQFFGFGFINGNVERTCDMPGGDVLGADDAIPGGAYARVG